jgi:MFS family permease
MNAAGGDLADRGAGPIASHAPPAGRVIAASLIGNVMEWYDFGIYGYFAVAIGTNFFPAADRVSSTLAAFAVFAVGFLARPVGGVLFGHVGGRIGRKQALTASVALMAVPTVLIGLLPTYAQIGALAGAALVFLRLQGLAVGGEFTSSIAYAVEHADARRRGRDGSWMAVGSIIGIMLGSAVGALMSNVMSADAVSAWGWRIPFLLGVVVGLVGSWLRRRLPDTPLRRAVRSRPSTDPARVRDGMAHDAARRAPLPAQWRRFLHALRVRGVLPANVRARAGAGSVGSQHHQHDGVLGMDPAGRRAFRSARA